MILTDVYVSYPVEGFFTYKAPKGSDLRPGVRVKVDFNNRTTIAFVSRVYSKNDETRELKDIISIIDDEPIFDERLISLSEYIASNYICTTGEALATALPAGQRSLNRYKNPFRQEETKPIELTFEQKVIYRNIIKSDKKDNLCHLIYGVTGSGKTEIYIEIARYLIRQNRSVIYLVPEISLSSQIFKRLYNIFGNELIIYHSNQTANHRLSSWKRFYKGDAKIVIGTRSAVFLQCPDLGLIIIDEEHDTSYKEHSVPKYNVRRIAFARARDENCYVVMGSASPSVESLFAAENGLFHLHRLEGRFGDAILPKVEIVKISPKKPADMFSSRLKLFSKKAIDKGNQIIYLLNKRGFSPVVVCNSCGFTLECPDCSISLNYHNSDNMLCHYCGFRRLLPEKCEKCNSEDMVKLGTGTQRFEEVIKNTFRNARVFRLDQDSSRKKSTMFNLLDQMNKGEIDILLGTQMVAKGFDFKNVSVVGVLLADIGLNLPDFRASERTFALLLQMAGRCGRGEIPGRVIVQTLDPDNKIFSYLKNHDYFSFYRDELILRKMLDYPPFSRIARLLVRGKDKEKVIEKIDLLKDKINDRLKEIGDSVKLLGPSQAPLSKIAGNYRHHIVLKSKNINDLKDVIKSTYNCVHGKDIYLEIDIDPYDML
ncbi:MAG: primosomal protein N' [Spirochaetota bacterium]|nr:primosomal protein N' [Spirochaetota bacterium]